jgi:ABC-type nitrate/sulfonate/bicarbonate transport system substrate-binding protein
LQGKNEIVKADRHMKIHLPITAGFLLSLWIAAAGAQEKVIVSHTTRGSLSIGPLLYGIDRGFYRDEGIDLVYVSIRADLGIKTLITADVDYLYSVGTIIRGAVLGLPVKTLSFDFSKVMHFLMGRPEINSAAALKGKRVGVSSFGATGDLAARVALQSIGLDPNRDSPHRHFGLGHVALRCSASGHRPRHAHALAV